MQPSYRFNQNQWKYLNCYDIKYCTQEKIMPQTLYEIIWIFLIYAFLGWCTEVAYAALDIGKFVNRGFLNGPCCPVYGFGVLIVVGILTPLKDNLLILFTGSVLLTTVLEYITGWILEKAFHNKWWDCFRNIFINILADFIGYIF